MVSDKNHVVLVFDENNLFVRENSINTVDKGDGLSSTSTVERSNESDQGWSRWVNNITNDHNDNRTRHWQYEGHMFNMWRPGYQSTHQHYPIAFQNYCCSFDTASTPQPPVSPVEHSSGDLWQLENTPVSHAGFQRDFELKKA